MAHGSSQASGQYLWDAGSGDGDNGGGDISRSLGLLGDRVRQETPAGRVTLQKGGGGSRVPFADARTAERTAIHSRVGGHFQGTRGAEAHSRRLRDTPPRLRQKRTPPHG